MKNTTNDNMPDDTTQTDNGGAATQDAQQHQQQGGGIFHDSGNPNMASSEAEGSNPYAVNLESVDEAGGEDEGEYALTVEEQYNVEPEIVSDLTECARGAGLNAGKASEFMNAMLAKLTEKQAAAFAAQDKQLRADWGNDFANRVRKNNQFIAHLAAKAGLSQSDIAVLQSPQGYRLVDALRGVTGESRVLAGSTGQHADPNAPMSEDQRRVILRDMVRNPKNEYRNGLVNPKAPAEERRRARMAYNKIAGYNALSI